MQNLNMFIILEMHNSFTTLKRKCTVDLEAVIVFSGLIELKNRKVQIFVSICYNDTILLQG